MNIKIREPTQLLTITMKKQTSKEITLKSFFEEIAGSERYKAFEAMIYQCPYSTVKARMKWLQKNGYSKEDSEYIAKKYSTC